MYKEPRFTLAHSFVGSPSWLIDFGTLGLWRDSPAWQRGQGGTPLFMTQKQKKERRPGSPGTLQGTIPSNMETTHQPP